mmetsp:Transcript_6731/g.22082  ORF Transcript_6731/g.22082 Transcript_6731/m.22082 type:complete len:126 (-) Transcript_6731:2379-2756(-)
MQWCVSRSDVRGQDSHRWVLSYMFPQLLKTRRGLEKKSGARRRDDVALAEISGESVGYVTSVSAPAAAVGLASALISVKALSLLREKFSRASGRVFVMCKPPGKPVVPAEAHVVVRAAAFDEPWW